MNNFANGNAIRIPNFLFVLNSCISTHNLHIWSLIKLLAGSQARTKRPDASAAGVLGLLIAVQCS